MKKTLALIALLLGASVAHAQDTHYWNLQYGTRGELLGGMVVGSALDMSSTFYNPGSLARVENPSSILTASIFGLQTVKVVDKDVDQEAVAAQTFGPLPSMIAGVLPMKWFGGRTAYSFLTRRQFDFRMVAREGAVIGRDVPGDTLSVGGEVILDQRLSEQWGGFTWAKGVGGNTSIGATLYGVYRGQYTRRSQTVEALSSSGYGAALAYVNEVDFWDARVLAKAGVYTVFAGANVGLAFTTPSASLFGTGEVMSNQSLIGDADGNGTDDSAAQIAYGKDLSTEYRSPFSVALGASRQFKRLAAHATVEYFASIDDYTVLHAPAPASSPGVTGVDVTYGNAAAEVFNWGLGLEQGFNEQSTAYVSFIADRSSHASVAGRNITLSTWDIYHVNGGVAFAIGSSELTIGGGLAWGKNKVDTQSYEGIGLLPPTVVPGGAGYSQLKFIIGFAL